MATEIKFSDLVDFKELKRQMAEAVGVTSVEIYRTVTRADTNVVSRSPISARRVQRVQTESSNRRTTIRMTLFHRKRWWKSQSAL